jgi:HEAT repeat protein
MFMPNVLQFLRGGGSLQRYRNAVRDEIRRDPLIQQLPGLLDLPLFSLEGEEIDPATLFMFGPYVALRGDYGSGRSLALLNLAWHWLEHKPGETVLFLPLAHLDRPDLSPRRVLSYMLQVRGLTVPFDNPTGTPDGQPWVLLVDDWETLPPARREEWRTFVLSLSGLWPRAQVVITLPEGGETWKGFQNLHLAVPGDEIVQEWLEHLLPHEDSERLMTAFEPGGSLEAPLHRLLEVVLLAFTCREHGLPTSRLHLYERVYGMLQQRTATADTPPSAQHTPLNGNGHTPGNGHASALDGEASNDQYHYRPTNIGQHMLRGYTLARALADSGELELLATLDTTSHIEVAALLAAMLPDPSPLYRELWQLSSASSSSLLKLAICFHDRPETIPSWGMQVVALLARQRTGIAQCNALHMLGDVLPWLCKVTPGEEHEQTATLLNDIAPLLNRQSLLAVIDEMEIAPALRWAAADALQQHAVGIAHDFATTAPPPDTLAQAARCSILALGCPEGRHALAGPRAVSWLVALRDEQVGQQRRFQVADALLSDPSTPPPIRSTALTLLSQANEQHTLSTLQRMCFDNDPSVRHTALTTLRTHTPQHALRMLRTMLLDTSASWDIQRDALAQLAHALQKEASLLLMQCATSTHVPLVGRLQALTLLAQRTGAGAVLLRRMMQTKTAHPLVRAIALRCLTPPQQIQALADIRRLASAGEASLVRREAITALGLAARHPAARPAALAGLLEALQYTAGDTDLKVAIVRALGLTGTPSVVPVLRAILHNETVEHGRKIWLTIAPQLEDVPIAEWPTVAMNGEARVALFSALTNGETEIELPSSFHELVEQSVMTVRVAAAETLVLIGQESTEATQQTIYDTLLAALEHSRNPDETRRLLVCLAQLNEESGVATLERLLNDPDTNPTLCWLAIEQLGDDAAAVPVLVACAERETCDPFTRGKIAQALGHHNTRSAVLALRHLAGQPDGNTHLRMQAIAALKPLEDPVATETLLSIVVDNTAPVVLRGAAADALPTALQAETRRWLRELLRRESQPPELETGVLGVLGRTRDREALALMLRCAQSTHSQVALAALAAIAEVGDESVAPGLIQIAQNASADQGVRLHAVTTLMRLCGEEYLPFLRRFLDNTPLPLQLQALDCLLSLWPDDSQALILAGNKNAPLALRMRVLETLTHRREHQSALCELLLDSENVSQLRERVADMLGQSGGMDAVEALERCVRSAESSLYLRRRCIAALTARARSSHSCATAALLALSQLADTPSITDERRAWAASALAEVGWGTTSHMRQL